MLRDSRNQAFNIISAYCILKQPVECQTVNETGTPAFKVNASSPFPGVLPNCSLSQSPLPPRDRCTARPPRRGITATGIVEERRHGGTNGMRGRGGGNELGRSHGHECTGVQSKVSFSYFQSLLLLIPPSLWGNKKRVHYGRHGRMVKSWKFFGTK